MNCVIESTYSNFQDTFVFCKGFENGQEVFSHGGFDNPDTYVSSSRSLLLVFTTDDSITESGFDLTITGNLIACHKFFCLTVAWFYTKVKISDARNIQIKLRCRALPYLCLCNVFATLFVCILALM